ncbi:MAG: DUF4330 domain-containing protein [Oscillospiraceae bacterium]|nr:DUF4330 domain-containing protein [Oscillospiraceae bacterium]
MDAPKKKFKLRFNVFDAIIILAALGAGFLLLRLTGAGGGTPLNPGKPVAVIYTLELNNLPAGTAARIKPGDRLIDVVEKRDVGTVVSAEYGPYMSTSKNNVTGDYILTEVPQRETAVISVTLDAVDNGSELNASGFIPRGGLGMSVTGPGYAGSGLITDIGR